MIVVGFDLSAVEFARSYGQGVILLNHHPAALRQFSA